MINPIRKEFVRSEPVFIRTERIIERQPIVTPIRIEERQKPTELKPIRPLELKPAKNSETIRPNEPKNSSNSPINSEPVKNSDEVSNSTPNSPAPEFERIGRVGRQRRNEERKNLINSVRDVVLYRHIKGRHYPGLSADMRRWYEFFYFVQPVPGEKPFNANTSYEQHVEAYERGQEWIRRYESNRTRPMGDSGLIDLQARRSIR